MLLISTDFRHEVVEYRREVIVVPVAYPAVDFFAVWPGISYGKPAFLVEIGLVDFLYGVVSDSDFAVNNEGVFFGGNFFVASDEQTSA